jgi:hypothetical protein
MVVYYTEYIAYQIYSNTCSSSNGNIVKALKLVYGMPSSVLGNLVSININLLISVKQSDLCC